MKVPYVIYADYIITEIMSIPVKALDELCCFGYCNNQYPKFFLIFSLFAIIFP